MIQEIDKLTPLFKGERETSFVYKIDVLHSRYIEISVYSVVCWTLDHEVSGVEDYLEVMIKWDGCSHFWFGEKYEEGGREGYLHMGGFEDIISHNKVVRECFQLAREKVADWDEESTE